MITRPLDLAAKLRREPRNMDWLFFVNGGLLVLYFFFFGSPFVLTPALGVNFQLPKADGANPTMATHHINVTDAGSIFAHDGPLTMTKLREWLPAQAAAEKEPVLMIWADARVPISVVSEITSAAQSAGFKVNFAVEPASAVGRGGR